MLRFLANYKILPILVRPQTLRHLSTKGGDDGVFNSPQDISEPSIPEYKPRIGESLEQKKARIMYQSRKRGMLENDLLLSGFTSRYLFKMSETSIDKLDTILNKPSNDWDIFDWITGKKQVPEEYDNEVMTMIKEYVKNTEKENRTRMPDLEFKG